MVSGKELKEWVNTLGDNDHVAIDEGGLTLVVRKDGEKEFGEPGGDCPYYEIGGVPLEIEQADPYNYSCNNPMCQITGMHTKSCKDTRALITKLVADRQVGETEPKTEV